MTEPKSADFDWVRARHECSALRAFKDLQLRVEEAVKTRKELRIERQDVVPIEFTAHGASFVVFRGTSSVRFVLQGQQIMVEGDGETVAGVKFMATLTLNNDGDCRFKVNGQELREWQVVRMALETLFFD